MARGDHLFCSLGGYQHHAIDLGDGTVIQYGGAHWQALQVEVVEQSELTKHGDVFVMGSEAAFSPDEIVERAFSRMGEDNYCLFSNNCEHFVNWCRLGTATSRQVDRVMERTVSAGTKLGTRAFSRLLGKIGPAWFARRLPTKALPFMIAADVAQLGAEVAASHHGSSPLEAKRIGQACGLGTSVGVGAMAGGPLGAAAGAGLWAAGEAIARLATSKHD